MQRSEHPAQTGKQPTALRADLYVALHPLARTRGELAVEVVRHLSRRPPMIAIEARPIEELAHDA